MLVDGEIGKKNKKQDYRSARKNNCIVSFFFISSHPDISTHPS